MEPDAIQDGQRLAQEAGLADPLHLFALDINDVERLPEDLRQLDGATIFFVLHEILTLGEDAVIRFLQSFRRLLPGVPLIVFEVHRPTPDEMRKRPGMVVHYTMIHDLTHQSLVSRDRWMEIFHKAGATSVDEMYLEFAKTSVFTLR